jgi:hypothetical protein
MHQRRELLLLLWAWVMLCSYALLSVSLTAPFSWRLAVQMLTSLGVIMLWVLLHLMERRQN